MFTRVVNLLTFKGLLSRARRGKGKRKDEPRPQNPEAIKNVTNVTLCYAWMLRFRAQETPMFMRVVTFVTLVTLKMAPAGGRERSTFTPLAYQTESSQIKPNQGKSR